LRIKQSHRRIIARLAAIVIAGVVVVAAYTAPAALLPGPIIFKAGVADPVDTVLALYLARSARLYDAQGLWVDILDMNGGSRGAEELQAGQIDVMHVGLSSVVHVNHSGGDLRIVGALGKVLPFTLFAAPSVKSAADLKGAALGVSAFGSESDSVVTLALQRFGLSRNDVTIKEVGGAAARLAALRAGAIKATPLDQPVAALARQDGMTVLLDFVPEQMPWLFAGIAVRHDDIAARRELLARFLRASIEGSYMALADDKKAKEVLAKELKITSAKILDATYDDFKAQTPQNLEPSVAGVQNVLKLFPDVSQNAGDYVDLSLLDAFKDQGFFAAMETKYKR
jgi:NitT/TauT family transport system substrate-binding protein